MTRPQMQVWCSRQRKRRGRRVNREEEIPRDATAEEPTVVIIDHRLRAARFDLNPCRAARQRLFQQQIDIGLIAA